MITQKNIPGSAWVALTTSGQNATCKVNLEGHYYSG